MVKAIEKASAWVLGKLHLAQLRDTPFSQCGTACAINGGFVEAAPTQEVDGYVDVSNVRRAALSCTEEAVGVLKGDHLREQQGGKSVLNRAVSCHPKCVIDEQRSSSSVAGDVKPQSTLDLHGLKLAALRLLPCRRQSIIQVKGNRQSGYLSSELRQRDSVIWPELLAVVVITILMTVVMPTLDAPRTPATQDTRSAVQR